MILRRLNTLQAVQGFLSSIHQLDLSIFYLNNLHEGKKTASNLHPHYDLGLFFAILLMALFASQLNTQKISSFTFHKVDLTTIFCSQRWHSWKSLRNPLLVSCYFAYYFFQQQMRLNLQRHVKGQQKSHHKNPRKKNKTTSKSNKPNHSTQGSSFQTHHYPNPLEPSSPTRWLWRPVPSHLRGSPLGYHKNLPWPRSCSKARWLVVWGWPANGGEKDILSLGVSGKKGVRLLMPEDLPRRSWNIRFSEVGDDDFEIKRGHKGYIRIPMPWPWKFWLQLVKFRQSRPMTNFHIISFHDSHHKGQYKKTIPSLLKDATSNQGSISPGLLMMKQWIPKPGPSAPDLFPANCTPCRRFLPCLFRMYSPWPAIKPHNNSTTSTFSVLFHPPSHVFFS